jgi:hypothetical protein
MSNITTTP